MQAQLVVQDRLRQTFERQLKLCNDLEAVADSLPAGTDRQFCLHLARQIGPVLRDAHAAEEQFLFPGIVARNGAAVVERLRLEHIEDECFGEEVQYELLQLGQGTLYPALYRLEQRGLLRATWAKSETGRDTKVYSVTAAGRRQLAEQRESWERFSGALAAILKVT